MDPYPCKVTAARARCALGLAYVKGYVDDPLPPLPPRAVRDLITRTLQNWGPDEIAYWPDKLRVYPDDRDPRTHAQVVADVEAWAETRVRRYISHYRPRDSYWILTVTIDPDDFTQE